ncbi:MAG: DoxX family protein [Acidobacteria bacterium]|nr:DoxX family protein [Acidobacteriota bacterium]
MNSSTPGYSPPKALEAVLLCLRILVGWHLLYEGIAKIVAPNWSAAPYLHLARGPFAEFFHWLASGPGLAQTVDILNMWGLVAIGLALVLGCSTRPASAAGIVLLGFYYLAHPPLIHTDYRIAVEGHYLLVNKNLLEMVILAVFLVLPPGTLWGLDRLIGRSRDSGAEATVAKPTPGAVLESSGQSLTRREVLQDLAGVPILGVLGYAARDKHGWEKMHAVTGATIKLPEANLKDLKGRLPQGSLGNLKMSRLILGGNLIGGGAHARDLIYVSSLLKAYNTDRKVFETFELAERAGIDTVLLCTYQIPLLHKYRELTSGRMQVLCQIFPKGLLAFLTNPILSRETVQDFMSDIDEAIHRGAASLYINGAFAERLVQLGRLDLLAKALDRIKSRGCTAGIGGHSIEVPIQCEGAGLQPDYYVKSFHHDRYWSAHPRENRLEFSVDSKRMPDHNQFHDNMFDLFPEKTIEFMGTVRRPWIAFKVLAGGAIPPTDGFRYAFENGADFVCAGMLDFQVVEDVNIALDVLSSLRNRSRPWYS